MFKKQILVIALVCCFLLSGLTIAQEMADFTTETVALKYLSPLELIESLMLKTSATESYELLLNNAVVQFRFNSANNEVLLTGNLPAINEAKKMIDLLDVPPRQIVIEVKIVEVDNQKISDIGLDWQNLLDKVRVNASYSRTIRRDEYDFQVTDIDQSITDTENVNRKENDRHTSYNIGLGPVYPSDLIHLIQESGAGKIVNVPCIVTINNRQGRILDGDRITYVNRYSSYSNLFETQEINAGLMLEVTPSLGQSGYLKLFVKAKLTTLGQLIAGSPSESGQILENTVIVKDKEPFLLGSFKQTKTQKVKRRFPLLGYILPFIFSRNIDVETTRDVLVILTPNVIDLNSMEIPKN